LLATADGCECCRGRGREGEGEKEKGLGHGLTKHKQQHRQQQEQQGIAKQLIQPSGCLTAFGMYERGGLYAETPQENSAMWQRCRR